MSALEKDLKTAREDVARCASADGGLYSLGWYIEWTPGESEATLDGSFSAAELIAIAEYMSK